MLRLIAEADRRISDGKRRIDEQRQRILELKQQGDDTTFSLNLLATFIHFLAIAELRRETLLRLARAELTGHPQSSSTLT